MYFSQDIIILHELSHFIVAKLCECNVSVVSIGFGKPLYSFEWKETRYNITPWLLGGYCKLGGELESSPHLNDFCNLSYSKKISIALAGITTNIIIGLISLFLGKVFLNFYLFYFGYLSVGIGIMNGIPFIPCLDGGYVFYIPILTKIYGKEKGFKIFAKINKISFKFLMALNIACIPYVIYMLLKGL